MKKLLLVLSILLLSVSCGRFKRSMSGLTGDAYETCHRGVIYLQFTSGSTIAVNRDGKPLSCEEQ